MQNLGRGLFEPKIKTTKLLYSENSKKRTLENLT